MIIRAMTKSDLNQALILWQQVFQAGFSSGFDTLQVLEKYLDRNPGLSLVAENGEGQIIGALMCGHDGRRGSIYHTGVHEKYRGHGIGRQMEERALEGLRDEGIETGFLFINVNNPGSREFWTSIGWAVIDDVKYLYKEF